MSGMRYEVDCGERGIPELSDGGEVREAWICE